MWRGKKKVLRTRGPNPSFPERTHQGGQGRKTSGLSMGGERRKRDTNFLYFSGRKGSPIFQEKKGSGPRLPKRKKKGGGGGEMGGGDAPILRGDYFHSR